MMAPLKFLALDAEELVILNRLGKIIIANFEGKVIREPEPLSAT